MRVLILVTISALALSTVGAYAYCSEPSTPYRSAKPSKPRAPYCVNEWNNTHTCDDWEFDNYISDLRNYRDDAERYIQDMRAYAEDARAFAQCEIDSLD